MPGSAHRLKPGKSFSRQPEKDLPDKLIRHHPAHPPSLVCLHKRVLFSELFQSRIFIILIPRGNRVHGLNATTKSGVVKLRAEAELCIALVRAKQFIDRSGGNQHENWKRIRLAGLARVWRPHPFSSRFRRDIFDGSSGEKLRGMNSETTDE